MQFWNVEGKGVKPGEYPIGQKVELSGHFSEPVVIESVRPVGAGFECRVRLGNGTPDETILSQAEMEALVGQAVGREIRTRPMDGERFRLMVESMRSNTPLVISRPYACAARSGSRAQSPSRRRKRLRPRSR